MINSIYLAVRRRNGDESMGVRNGAKSKDGLDFLLCGL